MISRPEGPKPKMEAFAPVGSRRVDMAGVVKPVASLAVLRPSTAPLRSPSGTELRTLGSASTGAPSAGADARVLAAFSPPGALPPLSPEMPAAPSVPAPPAAGGGLCAGATGFPCADGAAPTPAAEQLLPEAAAAILDEQLARAREISPAVVLAFVLRL